MSNKAQTMNLIRLILLLIITSVATACAQSPTPSPAHPELAPPLREEATPGHDGHHEIKDYSHITNYEECVKAGFPVMRSMPPQCAVPDGRRFFGPNHYRQKPANTKSSAKRLIEEQAKQDTKKKQSCKNTCGNGTCEEIVCMAVGCPCFESASSCPSDCGSDE